MERVSFDDVTVCFSFQETSGLALDSNVSAQLEPGLPDALLLTFFGVSFLSFPFNWKHTSDGKRKALDVNCVQTAHFSHLSVYLTEGARAPLPEARYRTLESSQVPYRPGVN